MVLTSWVQLLRSFDEAGELESRDCVDWAVSMLESGKDSESIRTLASLAAPFDWREVQRYVSRALDELGVPASNDEELMPAFVSEALQCMLRGDLTERDVLAKLAGLFNAFGHPDSLQPFYMLYFALTELDADGVTFHWPDATPQNVRPTIRACAEKYLARRYAGRAPSEVSQ